MAGIENVTRIEGWITPRLERVLQRSVQISSERGYNYLGVEHVALALIEEPHSVPGQCWNGAMTAEEWSAAILRALPAAPDGQNTPVTIQTNRTLDGDS